MFPPQHSSETALPPRARLADVAAAVLVAVAAWIAIVGGSRHLVFDVVVSFR